MILSIRVLLHLIVEFVNNEAKRKKEVVVALSEGLSDTHLEALRKTMKTLSRTASLWTEI
jgi:hypothetical protein